MQLTKENYLLWRAQVMQAIRPAELEGFLNGDEKSPAKTLITKDDKGNNVHQHNPAYSQWVARDQAVLGYLLSSLTRETLVAIATCTCAADAWSELSKLYSSQLGTRHQHAHHTRNDQEIAPLCRQLLQQDACSRRRHGILRHSAS
jgi:hypothetical protein